MYLLRSLSPRSCLLLFLFTASLLTAICLCSELVVSTDNPLYPIKCKCNAFFIYSHELSFQKFHQTVKSIEDGTSSLIFLIGHWIHAMLMQLSMTHTHTQITVWPSLCLLELLGYYCSIRENYARSYETEKKLYKKIVYLCVCTAVS